MAPVPPLVAAAAVGTAKVVVQGAVFVGSSVAAVAAVKAMSDDGGVQQQNVTVLLTHLEQKEQHQTAFFLFDFEGGVGYFAVAAMIILIMMTCCGVAHCCGMTPMAKANLAKHHAMLAMLSAQRSGHRTSVVSVRTNMQTANTGGNYGLITPRDPIPNTNPGRGGGGVGPKRRESSVIPGEEDTIEKVV